MHGVTLRPGSSLLELQVRLVNRTPLVQTFLWWANVAVRVHDAYEAFFPPDVRFVADHARRAMSAFPVATGRYYGVDYGAREARDADLRWYRNIPVPTSYMAMGSRRDFFGGYDHAAGEGFVHWADHTISPGKKLWTWGDHDFGHAWDRELTDADGPYVELMAGVFTDNQPDFSFLLPGELRTFSQYWYPIVGTGPVQAANRDVALSLSAQEGGLRVAVAATRVLAGASVRVEVVGDRPTSGGGVMVVERRVDLAPGSPYVEAGIVVPPGVDLTDVRVSVQHAGAGLISFQAESSPDAVTPAAATEPPSPEDVRTIEELYLTGLHLAQYRHATRRPEPYLVEALRRDGADSRASMALGEWHLRRGELAEAERHLRAALERQTLWNANPRNGEASYLLGVTLRLQGDLAGADEAFGKAGWDGAFATAATTARAELALARNDVAAAEVLLTRVLEVAPTAPLALALRGAILRRRGDVAGARQIVGRLLDDDPLDVRALHERALLDGDDGALPGGTQTTLDVAHDEARAGLIDEALDILSRPAHTGADRGTEPLLEYTIAWLEGRRGDDRAARRHLARARAAAPDWTMPDRLEEVVILAWASSQDSSDPRAPYYLGNLLYDRRRYAEAIKAWRRAARLDPAFPTVHRNLGLAEHNVLRRPRHALTAYRRAFRADPSDARVLYELDQLRQRMGHAPKDRLRLLEVNRELVEQRDDLTVAWLTLLNRMGRHRDALDELLRRRFHPWEGGEGLVSHEWVVANRDLARQALGDGDARRAVPHARAAMDYPPNLGEGKHLLTPENELQFLMGRCLSAAGDAKAAREWTARAARPQGDPGAPSGDGPYWQALALRELGDDEAAQACLAGLLAAARERSREEVRSPYFATSLPSLLLFEDDLARRAHEGARYLEGLALLGLGRRRAARARFASLLADRPDHLEAALRLAELETS